jgi:hypothetical protein
VENINSTWSLRYGDGSAVKGFTATDTVHLGDVSQPSQLIGMATYQSPDFAHDRLLDGIFGLGFPPLSYTGITKSIIVELFESGSIPSPIVSFYLGRNRDGGKGEVVGNIPSKVIQGINQLLIAFWRNQSKPFRRRAIIHPCYCPKVLASRHDSCYHK